MKKFFQEFKAFISKGNIIDMAVGVIVGGAFSKIVTSLVNDILMPLISMAMGGKSLADLALPLNEIAKTAPYLENGASNPKALFWHYGSFIQAIIDFLIISLCVFLFVRLFMKLRQTADKAKEELLKRTDRKNADAQPADDLPAAEAAADVVAEEAPATDAQSVPAAETTASNADKEDRIIELLTEIKNSIKGEDRN